MNLLWSFIDLIFYEKKKETFIHEFKGYNTEKIVIHNLYLNRIYACNMDDIYKCILFIKKNALDSSHYKVL